MSTASRRKRVVNEWRDWKAETQLRRARGMFSVFASHHCLPQWEGRWSHTQLSTSVRDSAHLPLPALQAQTFAIYRKIARSLIQAQLRLVLQMTIIKDSRSSCLLPTLDGRSNSCEGSVLWCTVRTPILHLSHIIPSALSVLPWANIQV